MRDLIILYPLSPSYSGSTLLSLLLGNQKGICCAGELFVFSKDPLRKTALDKSVCSCNQQTYGVCKFWKQIEYHLVSNAQLTLTELNVESDDSIEFLKHNLSLFEAMRSVTGCSIIVDSSKIESRFIQLREAGFKVIPIKLVRNPFAVVYSWLRRGKDWINTAHYYPSFYKGLSRSIPDRNRLCIHYEELVSNPSKNIIKVLDRLKLTDLKPDLDWTKSSYHHLKGNKMRFNKNALIRPPSDEWQSALSGWQKFVTWFLSIPVFIDRYWFYYIWERLAVLITWKRY